MSLFKKLGQLVDDAEDSIKSATGVDADKVFEAAKSFAEAGADVHEGLAAIEEGRHKD